MINENMFSIDEQSFFSNQKELFKARAKITNYIAFENLIILLLEPDEALYDRNVYCYMNDGTLKWQIPEPEKIHSRNYYTSIYLSETGELKAYNLNGIEVTINKEDGRVLKKELIK